MKAVGVYLVLAPSIFILRTITRVGDRWERLKTQVVEGWLRSLDVRDNDFRDWFRSRPWATSCAEVPSQDVITSRALGWIIKYCEVPQAIDIALQAIAGANERLPREPLEECRASSALSQHLASSNLYKGEKTNEQRISLYLRALSFLGSDDLLQSTGDIEVVLWDMQAENEMKVSALLTDGGFTPDDHNLAALRIDNMAASQVLSLLKDNNHDGMVVLNSILLLLRQHTNGSRRLHPAARLALLNAAILLGSCMPNHLVPTELAGLCIEIFTYNHIFYSLTDDFHLEQRLVVIVLLQGRPISSDHSVSGRSSISLHAIRIFQGFLTLQSSSRETLEHFVWFGVLEILSNRSQYRIGPSSDNEHSRLTLEHAQNKTVSIMETLPRPENHNLTSNSAERLAFPVIQSLNQIYTTASVGAPDGGVYMFVVECMLCVWSHRMDRLCWSIMSTLCFPKPSVRLVAYMEKRSLIQVFHKHMEVSYDEMKFFAAAQLWLLFALYIDPLPLDPDSPMAPEVDMKKLKALLEQSPLLKGDASNIGQAMEELGLQIEELEAGIKWEEGPPTIYALRVLECVLQSRGCASSDPRWVKINNELVDTPAALRGLGSFTPLPMRQPYGYTSPSGIPNEEYVSIPVDHEEKIEIQEAKNTGISKVISD
ncbi:hypothetical protein B0J17DRAFT_679575 [Rhizoctonia solani]|nr:hypothetical protein B0J17DRAFT_679575 [Rhizoctonia solani]